MILGSKHSLIKAQRHFTEIETQVQPDPNYTELDRLPSQIP